MPPTVLQRADRIIDTKPLQHLDTGDHNHAGDPAGGGSADTRLIMQLGMLFSLVYVAFLIPVGGLFLTQTRKVPLVRPAQVAEASAPAA